MQISHLAPGTLFVWGNSMFIRRRFAARSSKTRVIATKIAYRSEGGWIAVSKSIRGMNRYIMHRDTDVEPVQ
jgi:hypothetical protein